MNGPKIHREILESSKEICQRQKKKPRKRRLKAGWPQISLQFWH